MTKHSSRFMIKQRSLLKAYIIRLAEQKRLYGYGFMDEIKTNFQSYGFKPNHPEIYRSLHELLDEGVLERYYQRKTGTKMQDVIIYRIKDTEKANLYKKQVKVELDRCYGLLGKAIHDIYG